MTTRPLRSFPLGALIVTLVLASLAFGACRGDSSERTSAIEAGVSGRLAAGLRVVTFDAAAPEQRVIVYRGDYVRPELTTGEPFTLEIPALAVARRFPAAADEPPYFNVPDVGSFEFRIGAAGGVIEAIEYVAAQYREVSAREAAAMIANVDPVILDVRTAREYAGGHLANAVLIPVQELQGRLGELSAHKEEPVLVYCATGNRSTVAAKLLIDAGFRQVVNVRRGIAEWTHEGLPTVR